MFRTKGVGPSTTLAWPGWKLAVEVDMARLESKRTGSKNVVQTVYYSTTLVLDSRVLVSLLHSSFLSKEAASATRR